MACQPKNQISDAERLRIWQWAKENGIDKGATIEQVTDAINKHFYMGKAKPEWINDILSGNKTPFRHVANDLWRKQYNRRVITQQAEDLTKLAAMGKVGKTLRVLWALPRTAAVIGHGVVFPITHGGDLIFRPESWGIFLRGLGRTYRGAAPGWMAKGLESVTGGKPFGEAYVGQVLNNILQGDPLFDMALRGGLDAGPRSHPSGLISRTFRGPAARAWDMLTVMRFELWKQQMGKWVKPGMAEPEVLDIATQLAEWANHATGSGKGVFQKLTGELAFGPKLTQAKINRLTIDPAKTVSTFTRMALKDPSVTAGERAVAWTRLSGATQFLAANLGFLALNQAVMSWLGSKQKVNYTDPTQSDWMSFKGTGLKGYIPGLHSELRLMANVLATSFAAQKGTALQKEWYKNMRGEGKISHVFELAGKWLGAKAQPGISHGLEALTAQDWMGRPLPFATGLSPKEKQKQLGWGEWALSMGPIPLTGPIEYVYDQLRQQGATSQDAMGVLKSFITVGLADPKTWTVFGIGATGAHIQEEHPHKAATRQSTRLFPNPIPRAAHQPNPFKLQTP